jgi:serine/threonine protein kinase
VSNSNRQSRVKQILDEAADLTSAQREEFLASACAGDESLRSEVDSLLKHLEFPTDTSDQTHPISDPISLGLNIPMPTKIGPYEVIDKIGEGGMGVVYKATQNLPRRTVALKVIKPQMVTRNALERFRFETQVLGRLQHPGIAQIYDAGTTKTDFGEQPYFAMEYIRGTPLSEYVKLRHCSLPERLALVQKIADAVHHAHTRGVVHRDIKPANILVTEDGQPKILDFGVARSVGSGLHETDSMTRIGQLVGTVPYMSPEQVSGESDEIDARSDIYSLGVVLYELLAGRLPYELERELIHEAVRVIREVEPAHLSTVSKAYKGDIETIVGKALSKERTRRYQSASEFSADIHRYLNNQPVMARPASAWYQVTKLAKRHKMTAIGASLAAAGILLGLGVAIWQLNRAVSAENRLQNSNTELLASLEETKEQRDRAEGVLAQLRQLTGSLADFEHSIRRLEGATSARRVLATSAISVLAELQDSGESYPWIREDIAKASLSMGEVALASSETLDLAGAAFDGAHDLYSSLASDSSENDSFRAGTIRAKLGQSAVLMRSGTTQAAAALAADAELGSKELLDDNPDLDSFRMLHARASIQRAGILRQQGRRDEAMTKYTSAAGVLDTIHTPTAETKDLAIRTLRGKAILHDELDQADEAAASFDRALTASRAFVEQEPRDAVGKVRLMELLYFIAERHETKGDDETALTYHLERLALADDLVHADPDNESAMVAVVTSHDAIGHAQLELGQVDNAKRSGLSFLSAARLQADMDPTDLVKHRRVALAEEFLGDIYRETNVRLVRDLANQPEPDAAETEAALADLGSAITHYSESFGTLQWLESMDPASSRYLRDSARVQVKLARTYELIGRLDGESGAAESADKAYETAIERYSALNLQGALERSEQDLWARALRNLATAALNRGEGRAAAERFEEADNIFPRLRADIIARKAAAYDLAGDSESAKAHAGTVLEMLAEQPDTPRAEWLAEQMNAIINQ